MKAVRLTAHLHQAIPSVNPLLQRLIISTPFARLETRNGSIAHAKQVACSDYTLKFGQVLQQRLLMSILIHYSLRKKLFGQKNILKLKI